MADNNQKPPAGSKSMFQIIRFAIFQFILISFQRLFCIKTIQGWGIMTQVAVNVLRYNFDSDLYQARKADESLTQYLNAGVSNKMVELKTEQFSGDYIHGEPKPDDAAIVLYFHGGGYACCTVKTYLPGLLDIHNAFEAATKRNLCIFGLEYSKAPEAKYPTQINEAVACYTYFREKFPNHKLFVMGDSAGGNLALALVQKLKQNHMQQPDAAVLISPWVKMLYELDQQHRERSSETDFVEAKSLPQYTEYYLPEPISPESANDPLVSPIYGDFSQTCPILVHYGGYEWMAPEIEQFNEKIKAQGADLVVEKEPFGPHVTPILRALFRDMSQRGINVITEYLASRLTN